MRHRLRAAMCGPLVIAAWLAALPAMAADAPPPTLVFELALRDTSGEGINVGQGERIARTTAILRDALDASGRYAVLDTPDGAPRFDPRCDACVFEEARRAGAEVAVTGVIHKISSLILSMEVIIRDAGTGVVLAAGTASIRGDNDRAWERGMEWLLDHRLLARR